MCIRDRANSLSHKYPSKYKYLLSLITVKSMSFGSNSTDAPKYVHIVLWASGVIKIIEAITKGKIIDTTGAGDIYAGGFIHGLINNCSLKKCGEIASICAGQIITQLGSRSEIDLKGLIN